MVKVMKHRLCHCPFCPFFIFLNSLMRGMDIDLDFFFLLKLVLNLQCCSERRSYDVPSVYPFALFKTKLCILLFPITCLNFFSSLEDKGSEIPVIFQFFIFTFQKEMMRRLPCFFSFSLHIPP